MANRVLRDYTDSISVNNLSEGAETFFIRLMMKADDFGKFHANPKLLKANLYPLKDSVTEKLITTWMRECEKNGMILTYAVNCRQYLMILKFGQRLRKMYSKFPDPETIIKNDSKPLTIDSNPPPETETETETETKEKRKKFTPPQVSEVIEFFKTKGFMYDDEANKFYNHFKSNGWKVSGKTPMVDWNAAANNWIARGKEFSNPPKITPTIGRSLRQV